MYPFIFVHGAWSAPFVCHGNVDKEICPVHTLRIYMQKTKDHRQHSSSLFLSLRKPFEPLGPQRINEICKVLLGESGIDTSIFTGGSTRSTGTSAMLAAGTPRTEVQ